MSRTKKLTPVLRAVELSKANRAGKDSQIMFEDVSLSVYPGELVALRGFSSTEATSLLNCLSGLDQPNRGSVFMGDRELTAMRESDRAELRQTHLGVVPSSPALVRFLSVAENIEAPLRLRAISPAERQARVSELLELVGLAGHDHQRPSDVSVGKQ